MDMLNPEKIEKAVQMLREGRVKSYMTCKIATSLCFRNLEKLILVGDLRGRYR
jgi:hypothetical protein